MGSRGYALRDTTGWQRPCQVCRSRSHTVRKEATLDGNASFGYWVRRQRKALDLTQAELARRVG
jgi:hypothetical protein